MLFNSYLFIFCFLPIVWVVFHILKALSIRQAEQEYIESKQVDSRQMLKQTQSHYLDSKSLESKGQDSHCKSKKLESKELKSKTLESKEIKFKAIDSSTQASKRLASTHYMNLAKGFLVVAKFIFLCVLEAYLSPHITWLNTCELFFSQRYFKKFICERANKCRF